MNRNNGCDKRMQMKGSDLVKYYTFTPYFFKL